MSKRLLWVLLLFCLPLAISAQEKVKTIKLAQLNEWIGDESGDLYVINFWATWCRPCVAELPYFEQINQEMGEQGVKVHLVSLDFVEELEKVERFAGKKKLASSVFLLDETKYNDWIDKIASEWSGAIPATLFVNKSENIYEFHEGDLSLEELREKVSTLITQ